MSDEFITDVDDSLKQDRLEALWKEYGPYIIGGVVLAILITGASSIYGNIKSNINQKQTALLVGALEAEAPANALDETLEELGAGHKAIAYLTKAAIDLRNGNSEAALDVYTEAAADKGIPPLYRDYAAIQKVKLAWSSSVDKGNDVFQGFLDTLAPIAQDEKSPWREQALIQRAVLYAHGPENYTAALSDLKLVQESLNTTPSLLERAKALAHIYEIKNNESKSSNTSSEASQ